MSDTSTQRLKAGAVGWVQILAFVFATTGPMVGLLGGVPVAFALGNGIGIVGCFLLAGAVYLVFNIGFAALARHVVDAGAFYACVARGLSPSAGLVAAGLAVSAYMALQLCCYAMIGFFMEQLGQRLWGEGLPWWFCALLVSAVVPFCSQRNLAFAAWLLGLLALAEFAIMAAFVVSVLAQGGGPEGLSAQPLALSQVFSAGFGASMVFAIASFCGCETAAVYAEEARSPQRTVPRALYAAVLAIATTTTAAAWALISAYGPHRVVEAALRDPGRLWFSMVPHFVPPGLAEAMSGLLLTSLFAVIVGMQNVVSRYLYALGRDGAIRAELAQMHPVQETPYVANLAQATVSVLLLSALGLVEQDPLRIAIGATSAFGAIALVCAQILTSLAVIGFFRARSDGGVLATRVAPALSAAALSALLATMLANLPLLTGGSGAAAWTIAIALLAIVLLGAAYAAALKRRRPALYASLGRGGR
ncbi:APC family permease [Lysobacter enzymogenes]|uniref:APC family permease n=1 Tax=Lysobacter enzymogenes TaxID=69 RepID=UPI00099C4018|nr:APC family permease [Lysobacter enzymogenes]UZW60707.1 APC family permease [Lysobacter enzymogenes]